MFFLLEGNNAIDGVHGVLKKTIFTFSQIKFKEFRKMQNSHFFISQDLKKDNLSTPCTPLNNVYCWKSDAFKMYLYVVLGKSVTF